MVMKGKWAQGIQPRNFSWIMKGKLAVCERPGGYGTNHRRVRRQEEIIWIREQGFTCVVSIIPSPHNLHNYTELGVTWRHRPFGVHDDPRIYLGALYPELQQLIDSGGRILLHGEELGDRICGAMVGFLVWSGLVPDSPQATMLIEQITSRQVGPVGRELVAITRTMAAERNRTQGVADAGN